MHNSAVRRFNKFALLNAKGVLQEIEQRNHIVDYKIRRYRMVTFGSIFIRHYRLLQLCISDTGKGDDQVDIDHSSEAILA
jgi:hypothetical protein